MCPTPPTPTPRLNVGLEKVRFTKSVYLLNKETTGRVQDRSNGKVHPITGHEAPEGE